MIRQDHAYQLERNFSFFLAVDFNVEENTAALYVSVRPHPMVLQDAKRDGLLLSLGAITMPFTSICRWNLREKSL